MSHPALWLNSSIHTHTETKPSPVDTSESLDFLSHPSLNCCLFHLLARLVTGLQSPGHKAPQRVSSISVTVLPHLLCLRASSQICTQGRQEGSLQSGVTSPGAAPGLWGLSALGVLLPRGCPWPLLSLPLIRWLCPPTTASHWSGDTELCETGPGVPHFLTDLGKIFKVPELTWHFHFISSRPLGCLFSSNSKKAQPSECELPVTPPSPLVCLACPPLSLTISWSLLKLTFIESVMPSNHLILCRPLLLPSIFPSIQVLSSESVLCIRWPKYWSFSFSPSNEYSGLISFSIDRFALLLVQGTLKSLLQHHRSKASVLCIMWSKYWSFSFNISFSNEYSRLVSFRINWFDLLAHQGALKSLLQYHSSKSSQLSL